MYNWKVAAFQHRRRAALKAIKHYTQIKEDGTLELPKLPFKRGTAVEVIILPIEQEESAQLLKAAETSLDFWDNSIDDETWNDA
jgi:hypothetical protein